MPAMTTQAAPNIYQQNDMARQAVLQNSLDVWQQIFQQTFTVAVPGTVINVPLKQVGLLKRLLVKCVWTFAQGAAETQTLTKFGPANLFSQIIFNDLSNLTRIQTSGWHMHLLACARRQMAFGAAFTNDSPIQSGNVFGVIKAPASVTVATSLNEMYFEIPISYGDFDLRGAVWLNVVNATAQLQLTVNPNFSVATGTDATLAVYQSSTAQIGVLSSLTVTVYQNYLDQIPQPQGRPILPMVDLSYAYMLNNTSAAGLVVNQENPIPYANFRQFMSTFLVYDNTSVLNAGTDISYFALQAANSVNLFKVDPFTVALWTREYTSDDMPAGTYYFDYRKRPVNTIQFGNMQLIVNPSVVTGAASVFLIGYESLAALNQVVNAGSLFGT
jgi:hypothetical protein